MLKYVWSKRENDWMIYYPRSCDGSFLNDFFRTPEAKEFFKGLKDRGYDLTTLKFTIKEKKNV